MILNLEQRIRECFESAAQLCGCTLIENIDSQTVLLESGLDSLGFALLVAKLEEELGLDPFSEMENPLKNASVCLSDLSGVQPRLDKIFLK